MRQNPKPVLFNCWPAGTCSSQSPAVALITPLSLQQLLGARGSLSLLQLLLHVPAPGAGAVQHGIHSTVRSAGVGRGSGALYGVMWGGAHRWTAKGKAGAMCGTVEGGGPAMHAMQPGGSTHLCAV